MTNCHPRNTSGGQKNDIGVQGMKRTGKPCSFGNESTIDDDRQGTRHRDPIRYPRTGQDGEDEARTCGKSQTKTEKREANGEAGPRSSGNVLHATCYSHDLNPRQQAVQSG